MVSINSSYCCYTHSLFRSFSVDFAAVSRRGIAGTLPIVSVAAIVGTQPVAVEQHSIVVAAGVVFQLRAFGSF